MIHLDICLIWVYDVIMNSTFATPESFLAKMFWDKVDVKSQYECWEWLRAKEGRRSHYGRAWDGEKTIQAHVLAYKLTYGNYPKRFENGKLVIVRHLCGNCSCVNPNHLSLGTQSDNMRDTYKVRGFNKEQRLLLVK